MSILQRIDTGRVKAVVRKEAMEYRHNRFIVFTAFVTPVILLAIPVVEALAVPASAPASVVRAQVGVAGLLLLIVAVLLPATIAAYSVIGEREQGTLEPLLTTPLRTEELLFGKAIAAIVLSTGLAYTMFIVFVVVARFAATHAVEQAVWTLPRFLAELIFAPLLATFAIWMGLAISARSSDVRVAQQLGTFASLPPIVITTLMSFQVIPYTVTWAVVIGAAFFVVDLLAWRVVAAVFDRERLIIGAPAVSARSRRRLAT